MFQYLRRMCRGRSAVCGGMAPGAHRNPCSGIVGCAELMIGLAFLKNSSDDLVQWWIFDAQVDDGVLIEHRGYGLGDPLSFDLEHGGRPFAPGHFAESIETVRCDFALKLQSN